MKATLQFVGEENRPYVDELINEVKNLKYAVETKNRNTVNKSLTNLGVDIGAFAFHIQSVPSLFKFFNEIPVQLFNAVHSNYSNITDLFGKLADEIKQNTPSPK